MPSVSKKQHNLMAAVAHNPAFAKKVGIPQSVGQDFSTADKGRKFNKGGDVKKEMKAANIFAKMGDKKLAAHERREAMGKEKDTPAIAKKEMSVLKKAKAPKDVMDYEKGEHKAMKFAKGGGIESKGKTRGSVVKMASGGKVRKFAEGGELDDMSFKKAFRTKLDELGEGKTFTWKGKKYTTDLDKGQKSEPKKADMEEVTVTGRRGVPSAIDRDDNKLPRVQRKGESAEDYADPTGENRRRQDERGRNTANKVAGIIGAGPGAAGLTGMAAAAAAEAAGAGGLTALRNAKYFRDIAPIGELIRSGRYGGYKKGGSVKKYARGGGIESKGKTKGRFI